VPSYVRRIAFSGSCTAVFERLLHLSAVVLHEHRGLPAVRLSVLAPYTIVRNYRVVLGDAVREYAFWWKRERMLTRAIEDLQNAMFSMMTRKNREKN
jgi:hypothetical protein